MALVLTTLLLAPLVLVLLLLLLLLCVAIARACVYGRRSAPSRVSVAFFHPYCDAGGGGERVLWCVWSH